MSFISKIFQNILISYLWVARSFGKICIRENIDKFHNLWAFHVYEGIFFFFEMDGRGGVEWVVGRGADLTSFLKATYMTKSVVTFVSKSLCFQAKITLFPCKSYLLDIITSSFWLPTCNSNSFSTWVHFLTIKASAHIIQKPE